MTEGLCAIVFTPIQIKKQLKIRNKSTYKLIITLRIEAGKKKRNDAFCNPAQAFPQFTPVIVFRAQFCSAIISKFPRCNPAKLPI